MGLLAQEVAEALEQHGLVNSGMVNRPADGGFMSVRYNDLLAPMIREIQELDAMGRNKDAQIASLEDRLETQQAELLALVREQQEHLQVQQEQIARLEGLMVGNTVAAR